MNKNEFKVLNISEDTIKGIEDMKFSEMTPIQEKSIPQILEGKDIIGQAQTGTGKTAAFGIPAVEIVENTKDTQVLILCPTRELSMQVAREIENVGKYKKGLRVLPVYGGERIGRQINQLRQGSQIVVGTPGRVIDHIKRGTLKLDSIKMMILDEADEMFDMGFRDDMTFVMDRLPKDRQTIFFSATMPKSIIDFARRYQKNSETIKVTKKELTMPNIEQSYFRVREREKTETICRLLELEEPNLSIIFSNTKRQVDRLARDLSSRGYKVDALHGDLNQNQRDAVMNRFRKGNIKILVATDVAARGIDVDEVDMVFNYDLPRDDEYYVHRIGRTARAGRDGKAYSFVTPNENRRLRRIERYAKTKIKEKRVPTAKDLEKANRKNIIEEIVGNLEEDDFEGNDEVLHEIMSLGYGPYEIAKVLIGMKLENNKIEEIEDKKASHHNHSGEKSRIYINIGRRERIGPGNVLAAMVEETDVTREMVGAIDIFDKFTFVDVDKEMEDNVITNLNGKRINRVKVLVEKANSK